MFLSSKIYQFALKYLEMDIETFTKIEIYYCLLNAFNVGDDDMKQLMCSQTDIVGLCIRVIDDSLTTNKYAVVIEALEALGKLFRIEQIRGPYILESTSIFRFEQNGGFERVDRMLAHPNRKVYKCANEFNQTFNAAV